MAVQVYKTIFKVKRGTSEAWNRANPLLAAGEPGFELDTYRLKIGDGKNFYKDLPYQQADESVVAAATKAELPAIGDIKKIYLVITEKSLYIWNGTSYEKLTNSDTIVERPECEVFSAPVGTLSNLRNGEMRIMCPKDTKWGPQQGGSNADPNKYYIGLKFYAPNETVVSFKEDLSEIIQDQTMYYFVDNDFAGIDDYGRQYSIVWIPVAYQSSEGWQYYGAKSTEKKYLGWYYSIEWYDAKGVLVATNILKINLSNEQCHNVLKSYVNVNNLIQEEDTTLVLYGGSATDNI